MKRLFTFGSSFSNYKWPTWADIVSQDYDYYENWAKRGSENRVIHASLVECIQRNNITADDTIIIMWSRSNAVFADLTEYLIDSISYIQSSHLILNAIGCKQHFFSMMPVDIKYSEKKWTYVTEKLPPAISSQVLKFYAPVLKQVMPSMWETVFNSNWHSRNHNVIGNSRSEGPSRMELEKFANQYNAMAGSSWPTFNDFIDEKDDNVDANTLKEIDEKFGFIRWRHRVKYGRFDLHPTPMEHLEYLDCVNFPVSNKVRSFAAHWEDQVASGTFIWETKGPEKC